MADSSPVKLVPLITVFGVILEPVAGEFLRASEVQAPLRPSFRRGCCDTATILRGAGCFGEVDLHAPEP
ncbi:hypothetical protein [Planctomyces sp. SH-PL62]|uniref:hypothetical protein n=1 Tax=Planctomyces sp. SH-PL62 TaxID=1636152 RepID=UPI00078C21D3|nr:hypothetical protein [Planctomyces sp. SH-PL62]AMV40519.1 hypothetical protein VT85_24025 [Planctomyces sp. SH-PL62]